MDNLELLSTIDPEIQELLNALFSFLLIPLVPTIASTLLETVGCGADFQLMLLYLAFSLYYIVAVDVFIGVIHFWAGMTGLLTVVLLCLPDPGTLLAGLVSSECELGLRETIRDLDIVTVSRDDLTTKASVLLSTCLSA